MASKKSPSKVAKRKRLVNALARAAGSKLPFLCIVLDANRNVEFVAAASSIDVLEEHVLVLEEAEVLI